jgi:hypothetical protein
MNALPLPNLSVAVNFPLARPAECAVLFTSKVQRP